MIGSLRGRVREAGKGRVLLEVCGVGYEVRVAPQMMELPIPPAGEELTLLIHEHWSERGPTVLCGFVSAAEREHFRRLLKVPGVGPAAALAVAGAFTAAEMLAVAQQGAAGRRQLERRAGVGRKLAERIQQEVKRCGSRWSG